MMNNFEVYVTSDDEEDFESVMKLAFKAAAAEKATHYRVAEEDGVTTMTLYWHEDKLATPLPYAMDYRAMTSMVMSWLKQLPNSAFGDIPDFDGSYNRGYNVCAKNFDGWSYAFFKIKPVWGLYGK
jgi:hypothetical protein